MSYESLHCTSYQVLSGLSRKAEFLDTAVTSSFLEYQVVFMNNVDTIRVYDALKAVVRILNFGLLPQFFGRMDTILRLVLL